MAIIGYIPPAADPGSLRSTRSLCRTMLRPPRRAVELPFPEVTDTAAEEKPAKRTKRAATKE